MARVIRELVQGERTDLLELARFVLEALANLVQDLAQRLQEIEKKLISWHYRNDLSNRLETIAGVGLVARQNSSGGKTRLGRISRQGNRYIRQLPILGATSVLRYVRRDRGGGTSWVGGLLRRRRPAVDNNGCIKGRTHDCTRDVLHDRTSFA
ncbi:transposase [Phyllobacterium calauticae]|uniref:transposase n=1 Tax=Phyllobacterium calauticae TaxID=2817027 RepID=UPI003857D645